MICNLLFTSIEGDLNFTLKERKSLHAGDAVFKYSNDKNNNIYSK